MVSWVSLSGFPERLSHLQHAGLACCFPQSAKPTHVAKCWRLLLAVSSLELPRSHVTTATKVRVMLYTKTPLQALRGCCCSSQENRVSLSCEIIPLVSLTHSHSQGHNHLALSNPLCMEAAVETGGATSGLIKGSVRDRAGKCL